jgi:hypothetical protein
MYDSVSPPIIGLSRIRTIVQNRPSDPPVAEPLSIASNILRQGQFSLKLFAKCDVLSLAPALILSPPLLYLEVGVDQPHNSLS